MDELNKDLKPVTVESLDFSCLLLNTAIHVISKKEGEALNLSFYCLHAGP